MHTSWSTQLIPYISVIIRSLMWEICYNISSLVSFVKKELPMCTTGSSSICLLNIIKYGSVVYQYFSGKDGDGRYRRIIPTHNYFYMSNSVLLRNATERNLSLRKKSTSKSDPSLHDSLNIFIITKLRDSNKAITKYEKYDVLN